MQRRCHSAHDSKTQVGMHTSEGGSFGAGEGRVTVLTHSVHEVHVSFKPVLSIPRVRTQVRQAHAHHASGMQASCLSRNGMHRGARKPAVRMLVPARTVQQSLILEYRSTAFFDMQVRHSRSHTPPCAHTAQPVAVQVLGVSCSSGLHAASFW
jgi:hypothetical protein